MVGVIFHFGFYQRNEENYVLLETKKTIFLEFSIWLKNQIKIRCVHTKWTSISILNPFPSKKKSFSNIRKKQQTIVFIYVGGKATQRQKRFISASKSESEISWKFLKGYRKGFLGYILMKCDTFFQFIVFLCDEKKIAMITWRNVWGRM